MKFKVGDQVTWESRSQGYDKVKTGTVVAIIPKGDMVTHRYIEDFTGKQWWMKFRLMFYLPAGARSQESYLVEVKDGKTDKAMPKLYWPRVKWLKEAL